MTIQSAGGPQHFQHLLQKAQADGTVNRQEAVDIVTEAKRNDGVITPEELTSMEQAGIVQVKDVKSHDDSPVGVTFELKNEGEVEYEFSERTVRLKDPSKFNANTQLTQRHGESLGSYAKGTDAYKTLKNYFDIKGSEHIPAAQMNTNKEALFTELGVNSYDGLTNALVSGGLNQEDASKVTHLYQHSEALERINQNLDSPVALRDEMTAIYQDFTGSIDVPDAREIKNLFKEIGMPTNTAVFNQMVRYALQPSSEVKAGSRFESDGVDVANYIENMGTDEYLEAVSTRFLTEGESMQNAAQNDFKDIREMFGQDSNRFSQALNTGFPNNQLSSEEAGEFLGLMSGTQTHQDVGRMQELIGKIDPGFQDFLLENAPEGSTSGVDEKYGFATTKSFRALNAMFQESIHEVVTVEHKSFEGELPEVDGYFDLGILGVAKISYKNNSSSSNSWIQTNPVKGNKNGPLTECELFK